MSDDYQAFLASKAQSDDYGGFDPLWMPDFLFDFQQSLTDWAIRKGRAAIFAECGLGKGQPYGSLILTPGGWREIETLRAGEHVIASNGKPAEILGVYHKQPQQTHRVSFSDGSSIVVDEDHLHICRTNNDRQRRRPWRVMSTRELIDSGNVRYGDGGKSRNYDIPIVGDVEYESGAALPIDPYVVGVLLGDGHLSGNVSVSSGDAQIVRVVEAKLPEGVTLKRKSKYDYNIMTGNTGNRRHPFRAALCDLGLMDTRSHSKFIPEIYLRAGVKDRVALLRGLMDTDGYVSGGGCCQFYSVSERLTAGMIELLRSLGGVPTASVKATSCDGKPGRPCHIATFSLKTRNPFLLHRKASRWNPNPRDNGRWIDSITPDVVQPTICLAVNSSDQSYVTERFVVTHNTPMQLVWAENVVRKTSGRVLILTPLAVSAQTIREAEKFGITAHRTNDGTLHDGINVTNYERLHYFNAPDFVGVVCDESSALKALNGARRKLVTRFMSKMDYRLLCTATAAPNDFVELGTSSEALGHLGYMDMLGMFFKNDENVCDPNHPDAWHNRFQIGWRFKKHAEERFWKWVCSWARACRKPSDLGFDDSRFLLPPLTVTQTVVGNPRPLPGFLFALPAVSLSEQRDERRQTMTERCTKVAELIGPYDYSVVWCHLNAEGAMLERLIPNSVEVAGRHDDEYKEAAAEWFLGERCICNDQLFGARRKGVTSCACGHHGGPRRLISKPRIFGFGLNLQHCAHMTFFPSHSFEQYYQGVRRCWRFGQIRPVHVDVVTTDGERNVTQNLSAKAERADKMFEKLTGYMTESLAIARRSHDTNETPEVPSWL